jgi:hypothetical protein
MDCSRDKLFFSGFPSKIKDLQVKRLLQWNSPLIFLQRFPIHDPHGE